MWLFNSSIGRKFVMALTGAALVLFVTFHCLMNSVALFWPAAYNVVCEFLGANWYALIASAGLGALLIIHIIYAVWLTIQNRSARGNDRYAVTSKPAQVEWSSQNMLVLGIVIIAFLVIHLIQFWCKMQFAEIMGCEVVDPATTCPVSGQPMQVPPAAGTWFIQMAFSQWYTLPVYLIGFIALWFHMTHGFWSMFQSIGWNGSIWMPRIKCIANWWTSIVIALFVAQAIVFTVKANEGEYTDCPALLEQYRDMMEEKKDAGIPDVLPSCCAQEAQQSDCCGNCADKTDCCGNCAEKSDCCGNCAEKSDCCGNCAEKSDCCGNCAEKTDCCGNCAEESNNAQSNE